MAINKITISTTGAHDVTKTCHDVTEKEQHTQNTDKRKKEAERSTMVMLFTYRACNERVSTEQVPVSDVNKT